MACVRKCWTDRQKRPKTIVAIRPLWAEATNNDHPVTEIHNYNWIGKNRLNGKDGGIRFIYNSKNISINDANLLKSKSDGFARLGKARK